MCGTRCALIRSRLTELGLSRGEFAQRQDNNFLRLGEIGANVKPTYGAKTLNKLASASGIKYSSFKCYVAVYRAYTPEFRKSYPLTFSVAQALATHPDRQTR